MDLRINEPVDDPDTVVDLAGVIGRHVLADLLPDWPHRPGLRRPRRAAGPPRRGHRGRLEADRRGRRPLLEPSGRAIGAWWHPQFDGSVRGSRPASPLACANASGGRPPGARHAQGRAVAIAASRLADSSMSTVNVGAERQMSLQSQIEQINVPQEFTSLCNAVRTAKHGDDFLPIDDDRPDCGNDGYLRSQRKIFAGHCFKRVQNRSLDEEIHRKMSGDLHKAINLKKEGDLGGPWIVES